MSKKKQIDPIPAQFTSLEEAAKFRETQHTTDYPGVFRKVPVVAELRNRHYEIPIDADVIKSLEGACPQGRRGHLGASRQRSAFSSPATHLGIEVAFPFSLPAACPLSPCDNARRLV